MMKSMEQLINYFKARVANSVDGLDRVIKINVKSRSFTELTELVRRSRALTEAQERSLADEELNMVYRVKADAERRRTERSA